MFAWLSAWKSCFRVSCCFTASGKWNQRAVDVLTGASLAKVVGLGFGLQSARLRLEAVSVVPTVAIAASCLGNSILEL